MHDIPTRPAIVPALFYDDPVAAMAWLEQAFGFETTLKVADDAGNIAYSEMSFRGSAFSVTKGFEGPPIAPARTRSPASLDGCCTQFLRLTLADGLDRHCERARAAGARIVQEPADQFYGARTYRALDPEGHVWTFSQDIPAPNPERSPS